MYMKQLLLLALSFQVFALPVPLFKALQTMHPITTQCLTLAGLDALIYSSDEPSLQEIHTLLNESNHQLSSDLIDNALRVIACARQQDLAYQPILTLIDYSKPSNEKRLWVFDLRHKKRLFYTYASHGIKSGTRYTQFFSNVYNSKASSMGVYLTNKAYYGREGLSLKLDGLDKGFNHNAANRAIVMHGGWYVEPDFIKQYHRAGRSWGCPALPHSLSDNIINTIKNKSLLIMYYPDSDWYAHSPYLNCMPLSPLTLSQKISVAPPETLPHPEIVFFDKNNNHRRDESDPIVVIKALDYQKIFQQPPPVARMLRRQVKQQEYIAINAQELDKISTQLDTVCLYFVLPKLKMQRGYYLTMMQLTPVGNILAIRPIVTKSHQAYEVRANLKPIMRFDTTTTFIRWLGL
ncbi:MAG: hypothetical protein CMF38_06905 [Legionellaceae bacterium]|nr:hypothetical protein [Legionellaceae bacterium]HCA89531.1 hypothetical protein [Legionellales bacterium]